MRYFTEAGESEKEAFNAFIAASERGHVFQSWEWGELKKGDGWRPYRFIVRDGTVIKAAATILEKILPGGYSVFHAPRGPVLDYSDAATLDFFFAALKRFCSSRRKAILLQIDPDIRQSDAAAKEQLIRNGFLHRPSGLFYITQPNHVFRLDISPAADVLYSRFSSSTRRNIRIAQNGKVEVEARDDRAAVKIFYRLLALTGRRKHFLIRSFNYQKRIYESFIRNGYGKVFLAKYGGRYIAARLALKFGSKCWDMYAGSDRKHAELKASHLLVWEMINWARSSGCSVFDFRGAGSWDDPSHPDRGIYDFKAKFGPELIEFIGEYYFIFNSALYSKYESLHELLQKLIKLPGKILRLLSRPNNLEKLARLTFDKYGEKEELEEYSRRAIAEGLGFEEKFVTKYLKLSGTVLVEGCGAGRESIHLAKKGFNVTGVDFQPKMIGAAKANAGKMVVTADFEQMNALKLSFPDKTFDAVLMFGSILGYIPGRNNRLRTLKEANRVLKNGGVILISVPSKNCALKYRLYYFVMDNLRRLFDTLGFAVLETGDRIVRKVSGDVVSKGGCFFHMFSLPEMREDLKASGFELVEASSRKEILNGSADPAGPESDYFMYFSAKVNR